MGGERLAIGEDGDGGVVLAAGRDEIGGEVFVEGRALGIERGVPAFGIVEQFFYGHVAALPVGAEVALEELDGVALGVGDEEMAADRRFADGAEIEGHGEMRTGAGGGLRHGDGVALGERAFAGEVGDGIGIDDGGCVFVFGNGEMEVAPIDAEIVAGAVEDVLVARTDGEDVEARGVVAARGGPAGRAR